MARIRRPKSKQASSFDQAHSLDADGETGDNYNLRTVRSTAANAGNTGVAPVDKAYAGGKRAVQGGRMNFVERRKKMRARVKQHAQRPNVSSRQYGFAPLAMIPRQGGAN